MNGPVTWSFTTDPLQPAVSFHTPASGANGVAVSSTPTATFNEAVQPSTIRLHAHQQRGTSVAGDALLQQHDRHRDVHAERTAGLRHDLHGHRQRGQRHRSATPMRSAFSWSFTTDPLQPAVSSHTPASNATGVAVSTAPTATFNEAVQSSTISFTLTSSAGASVAGHSVVQQHHQHRDLHADRTARVRHDLYGHGQRGRRRGRGCP